MLALSPLPGCKQSDTRDIVARVGDAELTESEFASQFAPSLDADLAESERAQLIEDWVRQELLYQEALARGLHQQERLKTLIEQMQRDLLVAALLDAEFQDQELSFSEAAIRRYYDAHQDDFRRLHPEIKARHILLTSQREANARRQTLLQRGESFSEVARKYSQDAATRNEGGNLGYFSEAEDPVLWAACQDLRLKVISEPVPTEYGYHLIQILERCEAGTVRDLSQVRSQIVEALVREHHQARLDQLVAKLKTSTDWAIAAPTSP